MRAGRAAGAARMTFARALRAEPLRLRRSGLLALHLVCALAAGLACGAYFAGAPWPSGLGLDAYVQLLGALMPLMVGVVVGLDIDAERRETRLSYLLGAASRRTALAARVVVLWALGALTLALAVGTLAGVLTLSGRAAPALVTCAAATAGLAAGSLVLYVFHAWLALVWGRNVTIAVGAAGLMLSFFSVGGLAHGLMTGELTALSAGALALVPLTWATRLGSLSVELPLALASQTGAVVDQLTRSGAFALVVTALALVALLWWIAAFEEGREDE